MCATFNNDACQLNVSTRASPLCWHFNLRTLHLNVTLTPYHLYTVVTVRQRHPFNSLCSRTTWVSWHQNGYTILDFTAARDDGVAVTSAGTSLELSSTQITMSAPHHLTYLKARCSSWCPTNSVKALKAIYCHCHYIFVPSVLWRCWLGGRKSIRPVKTWVVRYWRGYLSAARCKWFAYGPADATATPSSLAPVKSWMVYLSGASLPRLSWKKAIKWM